MVASSKEPVGDPFRSLGCLNVDQRRSNVLGVHGRGGIRRAHLLQVDLFTTETLL